MSERIDRSWVVVDSIESFERDRCVDLFVRPDGTYGFDTNVLDFDNDADERIANDREVLGLDGKLRRRLACDLAHFAGLDVVHGFHQMRPVPDAVRRDHRDRVRELDWRERVVALADAR